MRTIVVASHSAGHIWPAIAFCQGLKEKDPGAGIDFVSTDGEIEKRLLKDNLYSVRFFRKERTKFLATCNLMDLFFQAKSLVDKLKPDLIVGFGGYLSVPFIICARMRKIPNFIHEQNFDMGLANKVLAKISDRVILSFPNPKISARLKNKALFLGFPLRKEIQRVERKEARKNLGLDSDRFTLLVTGGSQGAVSINSKIIKILNNRRLQDIQVVHITGFFDYNRVKQEYEKINIRNKVFPFLDAMSSAFGACDLAVCRAGAGTIAEIAALKVPAILIPYPYAKLHQMDNARFLSDKDAAILIEDKDSCESVLEEKIVDLKNNSVRLRQMSQALSGIGMPEARDKLAELAFNLTA
jgi:UDP-N-acetylglucosamine--N-acetylmuramyl-(pentapeptide) pyrophosphoryl-undecaprenol N-acetylglucosamine transferase